MVDSRRGRVVGEVTSCSIDNEGQLKGLGDVEYLMGADPTCRVSKLFGVYDEGSGLALRGTFVVDPEGKIKLYEIHDNGIGRDATELLRKVRAAQYVANHPREVCPAKRNEGAETLKPSLDGALVVLSDVPGVEVVAEGVEKQEDWDLISDLHCDEGQGFFIAKPMPGDRIPSWLRHWNSCLGRG